jgi:hypothetical protein
MYAPKAEINPIRADVDVDMNKKLSGEVQATYFTIFKISGNENKFTNGVHFFGLHKKLVSAATYKALEGSGADIIVHPNYVLEKHDYIFFSTYKLKVTGYAGTFKKFYQEPYDKDNKTHH